LLEDNTEVTEILSSDEEMDLDVRDLDTSDFERDMSYGLDGAENSDDAEHEKCQSLPTNWQDANITSHIIHDGEPILVMRQLKVERVELLTKVPSVWPVPQVPTAYIVDLRGPEFMVEENGKILTPDGLIKNKARQYYPICAFRLTVTNM
jgi:hypothetical protein